MCDVRRACVGSCMAICKYPSKVNTGTQISTKASTKNEWMNVCFTRCWIWRICVRKRTSSENIRNETSNLASLCYSRNRRFILKCATQKCHKMSSLFPLSVFLLFHVRLLSVRRSIWFFRVYFYLCVFLSLSVVAVVFIQFILIFPVTPKIEWQKSRKKCVRSSRKNRNKAWKSEKEEKKQ